MLIAWTCSMAVLYAYLPVLAKPSIRYSFDERFVMEFHLPTHWIIRLSNPKVFPYRGLLYLPKLCKVHLLHNIEEVVRNLISL